MEYLNIRAIADRLDMKELTIRLYHNQATRRRREGTVRDFDFPEPAVTVGRSPFWEVSQIEGWLRSRPGKGTTRRKKQG
jgi:hypothetical protein